MKKTLFYPRVVGVGLFSIFILGIFSFSTFGQENFEIIDKAEDETVVTENVKAVGDEGGSVWENYNKAAESMDDEKNLGNQLASGIMTWNTLLRYVVKLVRRLSQAGLLIGAIMIVYAGYLYATEVISGQSGEGNKAIKNAIIGVLVISFSYAIMKLMTSAFL